MKTKEKLGNGTLLVTDGDLKYIEFECLNQYEPVLFHCMSTRQGGVSIGPFSSLNLGMSTSDSRENIQQNCSLLCNSAGINKESLVLITQVHGDRIVQVSEEDMGSGFSRDKDPEGADGMITRTEGVTMVTVHADCVPVYLFEPGIKAASMVHSGWKGTLKGVAEAAVKKMAGFPGYQAGRLVAAIGPSIAGCCFEVGEEVYEQFALKYGEISSKEEYFHSETKGKWNIDLPGLIRLDLIRNGLDEKNIHVSGICTKCRNDLFFSYRGDNGATGRNAAFLQLKRSSDRSGL